MELSSSSGSSLADHEGTAAGGPNRVAPPPRAVRPKRLLVIGRRGRGKSSLCNLLLHGADWPADLPVSHAMDSVRTDLRPRTSHDGRFIVHDTTGFDDSVDRMVIMDEIRSILNSSGGLDGILFLMPPARCDLYDIAVFELYLQILLCKAPNSAVGVIFTQCSNALTQANDLNRYLQQALHETTFVNFRAAVLQRCDLNVCFVNNPDPSEDGGHSMTGLREASRANVLQLIDKLSGTVKLEGVWDAFLSRLDYWIEHLSQNRAKYLTAAVSFLVPVLAALATRK